MIYAFPAGTNSNVVLESPISTNTIQRIYETSEIKDNEETRLLKKVFLSNRSITCNDGSQAGFYLRKSHSSKTWIIYLEGGWYCFDQQTCRNRWLRQRHFMTSSQWPETRNEGGILSPNEEENPFWWNANHVFVPYCTSDSWSGSRKSRDEMFTFMGTLIVQQVVKDLVPLGLKNSTKLLLTGSSAGAVGVMINLDPTRALLNDVLNLKQIEVRGVADSGWFLDRTPYAPTLRPAVDAIRKGMQLWHAKVPKRCRKIYGSEPWNCYFGYRLYPTLKTPLFIFQWLFDEVQMNADNVGAPVTKQQWDYIHKMGDALRQSFENVSAVFAPSCISHSVLTKKDWLNVKIEDVSLPQALYCWERQHLKPRKKKHNRGPSIASEESTLFSHRLNRKFKNFDLLEQRNATSDDERTSHKRKRRKRRRKERGKERKCCTFKGQNERCESNVAPQNQRSRRSVLKAQKGSNSEVCSHRRLERCTWPQCNRSCPRLHNPFTGDEMDFIELLKSFGLDMESVADALGIDMPTFNNMDPSELLNLLTQQSS
ncbi:palmitoleoyl-protein carboxylesterase NOTUM-like isoform X2 [Photinus pyralis]|nr:palmitoleoyl-protein carboxylesterase NOTUM-like [Photinus pyralis]XP_031334643.1 palmitoleoyl-protein carboxylesterase NOTUM-like isoform X2 [Photinus pyralis]XP_031334644.1 palmitoleoyl-protein carboxylesterase NOTUM-like isoform X2 [Photinus pyralis]